MTPARPAAATPARRPPARRPPARRGVSLLELVVAGSLAAALTSSLHVVLRGARAASEQLHGERDALRQADSALRFVTRRCRAARGVAAIGGGTDGGFTLDDGDGTLRFFRSGGQVRVVDSRWANPVAVNFAAGVTGFAAVFYKSDGATVTADPAAAALIDVTLTVDLPRDHAPGRTVNGRVWVRPW